MGLLCILDGIKRSSDVEVFGLKESSQPAAFVSEAHGQHEGQRLHQAGVCLCRGGRGESAGCRKTSNSSDMGAACTLTLRQVRV